MISMYLPDSKQQNKKRLQFTNPLHVDMRHVAFCWHKYLWNLTESRDYQISLRVYCIEQFE